ncbi:hypothetical protein DHEL01_v212473 [Diaporthe helianthi]|uniref:DUF6594 domain-containing protein n=1 Tax=Diaporthe helianthi TaxID=158607 RepID=A0A2P5HFV6_DIAHE|nr:hypothetical protein DHEL01_v212473 [Diaporthe helianthi]
MEGYAKVASLMAKYDEFAILRRFKRLNAQQLLYNQAEIIHLEERLQRLVHRDSAHPDRTVYSKDWWTLAHGSDRERREQWRTIRKIRKKLDKYNERLLRQAMLAKLDGPNKIDLGFIKEWLERDSMGAFPIFGPDMDAWSHTEDLIALKPRSPQDPTSRWFTATIFPLYHGLIGQKVKDPESPELGDGLYNCNEAILSSRANIFTTVLASLLPVLSITVLYTIHADIIKLGLIVVFSACFSLALALTTNARRIEIFAATAA